MVPPPTERTHPPNSKAAEIHVKIILLNKAILHGGNAEVDAMMLEEWQPVPDKKPSQCLYGLGPDTVKEPGNPHLAAVLFFLLTHVEATGFESSYQENSRRERRMYAFADSLLIMYIITLHCQGLRFAPLCKRVRRSIVHRLTALFRLKSYLSASILE